MFIHLNRYPHDKCTFSVFRIQLTSQLTIGGIGWKLIFYTEKTEFILISRVFLLYLWHDKLYFQ